MHTPIGKRRDDERALEPREAGDGVRLGVEPMPAAHHLLAVFVAEGA
jgi:hypothetical protein